MKYILVQTQQGGCDYTIGCGVRVTELKAKNVHHAKEEAFGELLGKWRERDAFEATISSARIYAVSSEIDPSKEFDDWTAAVKASKDDAEAFAKEQHEREQLAKLQAKYGK